MKCPRCKDELVIEKYESVEIDRCNACNGVYLDAGELVKIILCEEEEFEEELVEKTLHDAFKGLSDEHDMPDIICPKCPDTIMKENNYDYQSGIMIDRCPDCEGLWLDGKELEKVQAYKEHWIEERGKNTEDWTSLYRINRIHGQVRKVRNEVNQKQKMGATKYALVNLFDRLMKKVG